MAAPAGIPGTLTQRKPIAGVAPREPADPHMEIPPETPTTGSAAAIPTLNAMGWMFRGLSPIGREFAAFAGASRGRALDVGCAYGVATIAALKKGASVIACDLDQRHLDTVRQLTPAELQERLVTVKAKFPDELRLEPNSLDGALAANVLHFFDGVALESSFDRLHRWLRTGGKLFISAASPYCGHLRDYRPIYERNRQSGKKWPGLLAVREAVPSLAGYVPDFIHVFRTEDLVDHATSNGFRVEKAEYFTMEGLPDEFRADGREYAGLVAEKI